MISKNNFHIREIDALETSRKNYTQDKKLIKMGFRLLLLMAMGLGAMYMMHLLAQDYDKIRQPVAAATRALTSASAHLMRGKREAKFREGPFIQRRHRNTRQQQLQHQQKSKQKAITEVIPPTLRNVTLGIDWKRILSRDPFECLQSLICQIMSGAEGNTKEAVQLMDFLEATLSLAPAKIGHAFSKGLNFRGNTERCFDEYPFCLYSAKTMLRVLRWFTNSQDSVLP